MGGPTGNQGNNRPSKRRIASPRKIDRGHGVHYSAG